MKLRHILQELEGEEKPPNQGQKLPDQGQQPPAKPQQPKKDETLKYEGKYFNGGFADGVKLEPASDGKISVSISIYGGGEPKINKISANPKMQKILKAYEIGFKNQDNLGTRMEGDIDDYLETVTQQMSFKIIAAMRELDEKIKQIIIQTIKG